MEPNLWEELGKIAFYFFDTYGIPPNITYKWAKEWYDRKYENKARD